MMSRLGLGRFGPRSSSGSLTASDFRKCGDQYIHFKVVGQNEVLGQISGMEVGLGLSVDSIIKMPFCDRNYDKKLEIAKTMKNQYQN